MEPLTFIVGGDLAPTESNYSFFADGNIKALLDDPLTALLYSVDYRIFNLEVPLTDTAQPLIKDGPNLIAPASAINGIRLLNPAIVGLANNHIMDQDEQGLNNTMEGLSKNGIRYVGAGKDIINASKPVIIEKEGVRVGIYACAEHEYSIAEEDRAGANPFDPLESPDHISNLKSNCDFVVVLYHGGKEYYRYPSPELRKVCRKMAEKGADLVICQHSHCIGAFERYSDSTIVYGQGNFLFDRRNNEFWNTSLLVKATFGKKMSVDFVPICKNGAGVSLAVSDQKEIILNGFNNRSENVTKPGFVKAEYEKFCMSEGLFYLGTFAGFGRIFRKSDKILKGMLTRGIYTSKKLNMIHNFIECEAHRELVLKYLNTRRKKP